MMFGMYTTVRKLPLQNLVNLQRGEFLKKKKTDNI